MTVKYKTGDTVQLMSGGPKMTVKVCHPAPSNQVTCQWFAGSKLESGTFPHDSLVAWEPSAEGKK